jgi:hypothetical protein
MPHPIPFTRATKEGLDSAINEELQKVKISRQGIEPNYTAATIQVLDDFEYKGSSIHFPVTMRDRRDTLKKRLSKP